jgi:hypothetical protein
MHIVGVFHVLFQFETFSCPVRFRTQMATCAVSHFRVHQSHVVLKRGLVCVLLATVGASTSLRHPGQAASRSGHLTPCKNGQNSQKPISHDTIASEHKWVWKTKNSTKNASVCNKMVNQKGTQKNSKQSRTSVWLICGGLNYSGLVRCNGVLSLAD